MQAVFIVTALQLNNTVAVDTPLDPHPEVLTKNVHVNEDLVV